MSLFDIMSMSGLKIERSLLHFGYDDAPNGHAEMIFEDVKVPLSYRLGNEGQGFEIAQSRLGPGRLHHCMRMVIPHRCSSGLFPQIGVGKRALDITKQRVKERVSFGSPLSSKSSVLITIGNCAVRLRASRLLVLSAADALDKYGTKYARAQIGAAKVFIPRTMCEIIDEAIQLHGAAGLSEDYPLSKMYAAARALRIADGPDEVHVIHLGKMECLLSRM